MATGILLPQVVSIAIDANGKPLPGALLQFYVTGTTTPTATYTSSTLATPNTNPVVANGSGQFAAIYLDPAVNYRVQLKNAAGTVLADIDPLGLGAIAATQAQVNAGIDTASFVTSATLAAWTGVGTALGYTPVNKAGDTATNLAIVPTLPGATSAVYLGVPVNNQNTAYTLILSDTGKMVRGSNAGAMAYTIPPNASVAYPVGTAIVIRNIGAGTITITRGSGVSLLLSGGSTSKDVAMVQWGMATMVQESANNWVISGTGIS